MTTFFFRAVAADGKVRSGRLAGDNEKIVARELRKQGLTPVYVGMSPKGSASALEIKLPSFGGGRRRDALFFTQEISTLLSAGVPLDRALSITAELTEKSEFRLIVLDVLRILKSGRTLADSLGAHPEYFSELYTNMVRAGEASGALAPIFERLSDFERTRDDLRNYIVSSMVYPALLACVGLGSIFILMYFVVPRFALIFADGRMKIPTPTRMMLDASYYVKAYWWIPASWRTDRVAGLHQHRRRPPVVGSPAPAHSVARRRAAQSRNRAFRPRHGHPGEQYRAAGPIHRHFRRHSE
jgi:general secretion pathway protein F